MPEQERQGILSVREVGSSTIVTLAGEVDLHFSPQVHDVLDRACGRSPERLILDLSAVGYMDSSGIGTLVWGYRRVQGYGGRFFLVGLQDKVKALLEITQLQQFFTVLDRLDEALEA
jgi:anti-sigma B factor antagonist